MKDDTEDRAAKAISERCIAGPSLVRTWKNDHCTYLLRRLKPAVPAVVKRKEEGEKAGTDVTSVGRPDD